MTQTKNNKIYSQPKLKITLDESIPVKGERPIARLHKIFQGFKQQYSSKGVVKR